jgi:hypothetical protein
MFELHQSIGSISSLDNAGWAYWYRLKYNMYIHIMCVYVKNMYVNIEWCKLSQFFINFCTAFQIQILKKDLFSSNFLKDFISWVFLPFVYLEKINYIVMLYIYTCMFAYLWLESGLLARLHERSYVGLTLNFTTELQVACTYVCIGILLTYWVHKIAWLQS